MTYQITPTRAANMLADMAIDPAVDFHALPGPQVDDLIIKARRVGYRRPKNANGSTARYFHAYLCRRAAKAAMP